MSNVTLKDKSLVGVDPWSPDLTEEQKHRIVEEVRVNLPYFFQVMRWGTPAIALPMVKSLELGQTSEPAIPPDDGLAKLLSEAAFVKKWMAMAKSNPEHRYALRQSLSTLAAAVFARYAKSEVLSTAAFELTVNDFIHNVLDIPILKIELHRGSQSMVFFHLVNEKWCRL
jgi:hypothetical protein